jgi:CheY-like chemotaxis protein
VHKHANSDGTGHALVVEDDPATRALLRRDLEDEGWKVDEAENGKVALEHVASHHPDLILLDLMMPVMDGFEFVLELRKNEDAQSIPIVVVTAKDLTQEERNQLIGGVEQVLQKGTFTRDELSQQVREIVAHHTHKKTD